ncbi:MAG: hypothetical protein ACLU98_12260, partial [Desulfovibrio fairfieldensis]
LKRRPRKAEFFRAARRKEKIGRSRIEHTVRPISFLQRRCTEKDGFAAGALMRAEPRSGFKAYATLKLRRERGPTLFANIPP